MRHFNTFSVAIISSFLASQVVADPLDDAIALFRRQTSVDLNTGVTSIPDEETTEQTTQQQTTEQTSAPTTIEVPTTQVVTQPGASAPTTIIETSTSTRSNPVVQTTSSEENNNQNTEEAASASAATSLTRVTSSFTSDILTTFTTVTDGSTLIGTSTSQSVIATTTDVDPQSLSEGGGSGGSSGLSDSAKKTIGGVVGGVGGALLLAGLAYTAWRIWGKKKNLHDDDLYDPNMGQDKVSSSTADNTSTSTPFNRTLDQYHNPGPVNPASNF